MKAKLCVPVSMLDAMQQFVDTEQIGIEPVTGRRPADVVVESGERREGSLHTVYTGGWMPCEKARALARKLRIPTLACGKLLDHLNIRIRHCGLGCFQ